MKTAQITVEYLGHLGTDLTVVNAARTSFGKESDWETNPDGTYAGPTNRLKPADANLIRFLATGYRTSEWDELLDEIIGTVRYGVDTNNLDQTRVDLTTILHAYKRKAQHFAPFCHPHLSIRVSMPIFLARQFVKHQIGGTWSEESRRYISDEPGVWFPEEWHTRPDDIKQGSGNGVQAAAYVEGLAKAATLHSLSSYSGLLKVGVAPEEARTILTLNTMTTVTWTGSLLFWSRVCNQRMDSHAQLAAQELAGQIAAIAQPLFPVSWAALVGE